ncbi:MAG: OmpA family protein [Thermodesulfobacteriota bacterium]
MKKFALAVTLLALGVCAALAGQGDVTNAQDPAQFPRLPGYVISEHQSGLQSQDFFVAPDQKTRLAGRRTFLRYELMAGARPAAAERVLAHYAGLVQGLGGRTVFEGETAESLSQGTYQAPGPGGEMWLRVEPSLDGSGYDLVLLEPGQAAPEATEAEMLNALRADGRLALYLDFDSGRAELKPEFQPVLDLVAALLRDNPGLRLSVEAHTDDRGGAEENRRLSLARAQAVVAALVRAGVEPGRLDAKGWGQARPLTANDTSEGRAQNRRVELVRQ